uniref:FHL1/2/3/5 N-terminal LIM domain-containing protein n=1 Tax=Buteo japonicus TaxID=224669 RepID=A0A8C0HMS1_9AVES
MTECFDCDNCKESLYGRKYIQMDNGPYCIPCYDAHFANTCDECKELIGHDCRVTCLARGQDPELCDHHSCPVCLFPFFMGKRAGEEITKGFLGIF